MPASFPFIIPAFHLSEPGAIAAAVVDQGYAVVRAAIPTALVAELAAQVRARLDGEEQSEPGGTAIDLSFIEQAPAMLTLLMEPGFLALNQALMGTADLVVHRSAAILRRPGSPQVQWHSDFDFDSGPARSVDAVLNRGNWPNGMALYLTGCSPDHGGLAVIPGSHRPGWLPPKPWQLSNDRRRLLDRAGRPAGMAAPGAVPLQAAPGDLIVFAARTYHAAFPLADRTRLSCGLVLRPREVQIAAPWPLSEASRQWIGGLPRHLAPLFDGYTGLDPHWCAAVEPAPQ